MIGSPAEVHLWWYSLDVSASALKDAYAVLSDDEVDRARRYRFARDRRRFVAARSFVRRTLAEYLSMRPREVAFVYGPFGKPAFSSREPGETVQFNLSHSGEGALLAVTHGLTVGVDVEQVVHVPEWRGIASHVFSAYENAALSGVEAGSRDAAFYRCWTRKEAFLKALGNGLTLPLDSFDVSLDERYPELIAVRDEAAALAAWTLYHLCPAEGYVAALAVEGTDAQLVWRHPATTEAEMLAMGRF